MNTTETFAPFWAYNPETGKTTFFSEILGILYPMIDIGNIAHRHIYVLSENQFNCYDSEHAAKKTLDRIYQRSL